MASCGDKRKIPHSEQTPAHAVQPSLIGVCGGGEVRLWREHVRGGTLRVGVDVGGTHTDAVLMRGGKVLAEIKARTTEDVTSGVLTALRGVLGGEADTGRVSRVVIGTAHLTNAVLTGSGLARVAAVRVGLPASATVMGLSGVRRSGVFREGIASETGTGMLAVDAVSRTNIVISSPSRPGTPRWIQVVGRPVVHYSSARIKPMEQYQPRQGAT